MANRELWDLESALGLDIDDLGALDETCRALRKRLETLAAEAVELVRIRRGIDLTVLQDSMVEGGFDPDDAWSRLDDVEEAVGLPEIEDLFDLVALLTHARAERSAPQTLDRLERRTGVTIPDGMFVPRRSR